MTDERTPQQVDGLDEAIDRTVQALMRQDSPATLRTRVMARLSPVSSAERRRLRSSRFGGPRRAWTPQRLAWAGAAAVVIAAALAAPRWWTRPNEPSSTTTAVGVAPTPDAPTAPAGPRPIVAQTAPASSPAARPVRAARAAAADVWAASQTERPSPIDPLPTPEPLVIAALETEQVVPEPVEIELLTLDALRIEPIHVQR